MQDGALFCIKCGWIVTSQVIAQNVDEDILDSFDIDRSTVEDYCANLDPSRYLFYNSRIGKFYFYYLAYLFNDLSVDALPFSTENMVRI